MGKSDKELATDLTVALINANPRSMTSKGEMVSGLDFQAIITSYKKIYQSLHEIKD